MSKLKVNENAFSEKEMRVYKYVSLGVSATLISVLVFAVLYAYNTKKSTYSYCRDTGLYCSITETKTIRYNEKGDELLSKEDSMKDMSEKFSESLCKTLQGREFNCEVELCDNVISEVQNFLNNEIPEYSELNLSELFPNEGMKTSSFCGVCYTPYKIENGVRYSKRWIGDYEEKHMNKKDKSKIVYTSDVPKEVIDLVGPNIIGYIELEEDLSICLDESVYEKDGSYYIPVNKLKVLEEYGYVYYFNDMSVDLRELPPSKEVRAICPDLFTWELYGMEINDNWCTIQLSNISEEELAIIRLKIIDKEVVDIDFSSF